MKEKGIFDTGFASGRWSGRVAADRTPEIGVFLNGEDLGDVGTVEREDGIWSLDFAVPPGILDEGVMTFLFVDRESSAPVGRFCILAGQPAQADVLAQLEGLQADLDQLRTALRREARRNRGGG